MAAPQLTCTVLTPSATRFEAAAPGRLRVWAPAKLNLNLMVGPPGRDGFHQIDSLVARISLYDRIDLTCRQDGRLTFTCTGAECGRDEDNLALRAAQALAGLTTGAPGADVALHKRIPPGRGLAGGSSDAAAVLAGLDRLWDMNVPGGELAALAASLGSDVPLFLGPPASRMTGRGEKLQPIEVHGFAALLVLPPFRCGTGEVYRCFDQSPAPAVPRIDPAVLLQPPASWRGLMVNQLLPAARRVAPKLADLMQRLRQHLELPVCLTGSGSAVFALCDSLAEAVAAWARLPEDLAAAGLVVQSNPW